MSTRLYILLFVLVATSFSTAIYTVYTLNVSSRVAPIAQVIPSDKVDIVRTPILPNLVVKSPKGFVSSASPIIPGIINTSVKGCGLNLSVNGATFEPALCEAQIIMPGQSCGQDSQGRAKSCPFTYAIQMNDTNTGHVKQLMLVNFFSLQKGKTYNFGTSAGLNEFNGYIINKDGTNLNLNNGSLTVEQGEARWNPSGENKIRVKFNLTFDRNVAVSGSGELVVKEVALP